MSVFNVPRNLKEREREREIERIVPLFIIFAWLWVIRRWGMRKLIDDQHTKTF